MQDVADIADRREVGDRLVLFRRVDQGREDRRLGKGQLALVELIARHQGSRSPLRLLSIARKIISVIRRSRTGGGSASAGVDALRQRRVAPSQAGSANLGIFPFTFIELHARPVAVGELDAGVH